MLIRNYFIIFIFLFSYGCGTNKESELNNNNSSQSSTSSSVLSTSSVILEPIEKINFYRSKVGLNTLATNQLLEKSAINHSIYLDSNSIFSHYEESQNRNFTGITPPDRANYVGYKSKDVSENIASANTKLQSVDLLFTAIYHRFGFFNFHTDEIGFGYSGNNYVYNMGNSNLESLCNQPSFTGFGSYYTGICAENSFRIEKDALDDAINIIVDNNPDFVVFPFNNDDDFNPAFYEEEPDPLKDYSMSGNPISIQFNQNRGKNIKVNSFKLTDSTTLNQVSTIFMDKDSDPNTKFSGFDFAIFPKNRLDWNKKYFVDLEYEIDGKAKVYSWSFKTRSFNNPIYKIDEKVTSITIKDKEKIILYFAPENGQKEIKNGIVYSYPDNSTITINSIDSNTYELLVSNAKGFFITITYYNSSSVRINII